MLRRLLPLLVLASAPALTPSPARAANALRPRTPAVYPASLPCIQTIQRGEPVSIEYTVPYDDTDLTFDELADSRKHQFFAFSRTRFDYAFPVWINQDDHDRSEANGDIAVPYGPDDILESSSLWPAETWVRITPDDPRLPITAAQAAEGVTWDTTDVAPGTWMIAAYTWEPEQNLWSPRFGAVRIEDPADPQSAGPTVFLPREDGLLANRGEPLPITGCVEAPAGSTVTASWGTIMGGIDEPEWIAFVEDEPVESGELQLELVAPAEAGATIKLRVEVTDPQGRSYVAYSPTTLAVVGEVPPTMDDDGGGSGCSCAEDRPREPWALLGLVALIGLRRRHREPTPASRE